MFVAMGLSAVFPVFHGLVLYGLHRLNRQMSLFWLVLEGFLYILGAAFYAVRMNLFKRLLLFGPILNMMVGSYTREASSREIRPLGQFAPDFPHPCSPGCNGSSCRITEVIRSCAKISCLLIGARSQSKTRLIIEKRFCSKFGPDPLVLGNLLNLIRFPFILLKFDLSVVYVICHERTLRPELYGRKFDKETFQF